MKINQSFSTEHACGSGQGQRGRLSSIWFTAFLLLLNAPVIASADQALVQDDGDGAGATIGAVSVTFDASNITVTYSVDAPYRLLEAQAAAGAACDDIPQNKNGNPKVGQFEASWQSPDDLGADSIQLFLTNTYAGEPEICIAAHAVVFDETGGATPEEAIDNTVEGAWADGDEFEGKSWATHFQFQLTPAATCPCDFAAGLPVTDPKWQPVAAFEWWIDAGGSQCELDSYDASTPGSYNFIGTWIYPAGTGGCGASDSDGLGQYETIETLEEFYACSAAINAYAPLTGTGFTTKGAGYEPGPCPIEPPTD